MDFFELAIAERLVCCRLCYCRVALDVDIETEGVRGCGGAERANDQGGLERLLGCEKLVWQVLVCLGWLSICSSDMTSPIKLTTSTLPFPLSLTAMTYDSSSPVAGSCNVRNAWCGLLLSPSSVTLTMTERVSPGPRERGDDMGEEGVNLEQCQSRDEPHTALRRRTSALPLHLFQHPFL